MAPIVKECVSSGLDYFTIHTGQHYSFETDRVFFEQIRELENTKLILTDSVQEEACILNIPCVTLRDNTERQETVEIGTNTIAGAIPEQIFQSVKIMLAQGRRWSNPYGDGRSSNRILAILNRSD
jgi:UDP-N-acetylglucosamine 2-epimerase (non-hydrolysing)